MHRAPSADPVPAELPRLSPGVQLLETEVRGALPALVVDHLLTIARGAPRGGKAGDRSTADRRSGDRPGGRSTRRALWADANGHANTRAVARVAPSRRILHRIDVARGFTPHQHYAIVEALAERADAMAATSPDDERSAAAGEPALLVAPAIDAPYRDDGLHGAEARGMLVRVLAALAGVARRHDCPVLVTRTRADDLAAPVANAARDAIHCERTPMGPRFSAEGHETLVYPVGEGLVQTTLAFWKRVLERRAPGWVDDAGTASTSDGRAVPETGDPTPGRPGVPVPTATEPLATGRPVGSARDHAPRDPFATEVIGRGAD